jgi:glutathione S-transferase
MLTLYDHPLSGNCHKVRLFLSMLGRDFDSVLIDVPRQVNKEPAFTAINPLQQIPVLKDDGYLVQDSQAILAYLARRYAPDWAGRDAFECGQVSQWLSFAANEIGNSLQPARVYYLLGEEVDIVLAQRKGTRVLGLLDAHLAKQDWLACGRPTIADVACFPYVGLCREGQLPLDEYLHVLAWIERIVRLDGYVQMKGLPARPFS